LERADELDSIQVKHERVFVTEHEPARAPPPTGAPLDIVG
jgi:hypothetical protein